MRQPSALGWQVLCAFYSVCGDDKARLRAGLCHLEVIFSPRLCHRRDVFSTGSQLLLTSGASPMSRLIKTDDSVVNASSNPAFSAILEASLDRRGLLKGLGASLALGLAGGTVSQLAQAANAAPTAPLSLGFTGLPFSTDDVVHVPAINPVNSVKSIKDNTEPS
jgi:hypothetical protein